MKNEVNVPKCKSMNSSGIYRWLVVLFVALFALPVMAGWITQGNNNNAFSTAYAFQSTSTMQGVGSAYSSNPASLNEDGQATYSDPESSLNAPRYINGPRRSKEDNVDVGEAEEGSPIGDAVLPLLLMSMAFAGVIYLRRRRLQPAE